MLIRAFPGQVIAAEGEHKASRALRHAAEVICESPAALQVYCKPFVTTEHLQIVVLKMYFIGSKFISQYTVSSDHNPIGYVTYRVKTVKLSPAKTYRLLILALKVRSGKC
jgi:hypothetical protein